MLARDLFFNEDKSPGNGHAICFEKQATSEKGQLKLCVGVSSLFFIWLWLLRLVIGLKDSR